MSELIQDFEPWETAKIDYYFNNELIFSEEKDKDKLPAKGRLISVMDYPFQVQKITEDNGSYIVSLERYFLSYKKFLARPKNALKFAFESGGKPFFCFESIDKLPIQRKEAAEEILEQNANRVDLKYLDSFHESLIACLNAGRLDQIAELSIHLKERRQFLPSVEMAYAYASVLYFSYDENPNTYDPERADLKIQYWLKNDDVDDFFLKTRMGSFESFWTFTMPNTKKFTKLQARQILSYLKFQLKLLSGQDTPAGTLKRLNSHMETLELLIQSAS
jgi:hypothetical protein